MDQNIILVGCGTMGLSIGRLFAHHGWNIHAVDPDATARDGFARALPGVQVSADLSEVGQASVALECAPENLALKQAVFAELEHHVPDGAPILSNTSGLTLSDMAAHMRRPERAVITHFFNPGDIIPGVEVFAAPDAPMGLRDDVVAILRGLGKRPVVLNHAPPGFIANRIQHAIMRECLHLVDEGVADPAAIDEIVQWAVGVRMALAGPFRQRDMNGLGTHLAITEYLYPDLCNRDTPSPTLANLVAQGNLGRRSGKGFFDWPGDAPIDDTAVAEIIAIAQKNAASTDK